MKKCDNSKLQTITFRVSVYENELIEKEAKFKELSKSELIRIVLMEGLSGFDRKQEFLNSKLEKIDTEMGLLREICLVAASAAALPFGIEPANIDEEEMLREQLRKHFHDSSTIGKHLLKKIQEGKL